MIDDNLRWKIDSFFAEYLESKGVEFKGNANVRCPFHNDKTPSAHFYDGTERRAFLFCYACGRGWDFIAAVRELENLGFADAVEFCCRFAGIAPPAKKRKKRTPAVDVAAWEAYMAEARRRLGNGG